MKKAVGIVVLLLCLTGCISPQTELDEGLALRKDLVSAKGCSFQAEITADYGKSLYVFTLDCQGDEKGNVTFRVLSPEPISGISGSITEGRGALKFDDKVLAFPILADALPSPVSAPWMLLQALRSGYITSAGRDGDALRLTIQTELDEKTFVVDLFCSASAPSSGEISLDGRKILTLTLSDFQIL